MRNSIDFSTYMVECSSTEAMRNLSKNTNNRFTVANVDIAISGPYHFYVVKSGADVERAKRWMSKHIKSVLLDLYGEDEYGYHQFVNARFRHLVQSALKDAEGVEVASPQRIASLPNTADTTMCNIRA